ncbi:2OG-Fe(II) oxygenase [Streptomyces viridosporus]|uniref:2OG-Fe(II) oxygenase n=1 Tax=Streptomyces viridosporus TaxID=67581 RepID=UPI0009BEA515|nr:2OG-Fe(II) oxygenase [Streptomyces viridosporus]
MSSAHLHDPFFRTVTAAEFSREHIAGLAAGRWTAVRVPGLRSEADCGRVVEALQSATFESYGRRRVQPTVLRFGVGVSDHRSGGRVADSYWPALDAAREAWRDLSLPFDPLAEARQAIGSDWPGAVGVGRHKGREMGAGVVREAPQGFLVHYDDAEREFTEDLLGSPLVAQLAFNLYLSVPETGGETVVWRRRWHPRDESFRPPGSYGYTDGVVQDAEFIELKPTVGEGLLFDSRNYHAVRPSAGDRRIALGFSIGLTADGNLLAWG